MCYSLAINPLTLHMEKRQLSYLLFEPIAHCLMKTSLSTYDLLLRFHWYSQRRKHSNIVALSINVILSVNWSPSLKSHTPLRASIAFAGGQYSPRCAIRLNRKTFQSRAWYPADLIISMLLTLPFSVQDTEAKSGSAHPCPLLNHKPQPKHSHAMQMRPPIAAPRDIPRLYAIQPHNQLSTAPHSPSQRYRRTSQPAHPPPNSKAV